MWGWKMLPKIFIFHLSSFVSVTNWCHALGLKNCALKLFILMLIEAVLSLLYAVIDKSNLLSSTAQLPVASAGFSQHYLSTNKLQIPTLTTSFRIRVRTKTSVGNFSLSAKDYWFANFYGFSIESILCLWSNLAISDAGCSSLDIPSSRIKGRVFFWPL